MNSIIENCVQNPYDRVKFTSLVKNIADFKPSLQSIGVSESEKVEEFYELGEGKLKDGKRFYALEVRLKEIDLEKSQVYQARLVANLLKRELVDFAFVSYYKKTEEAWKLALVYIDIKDENGRLVVQKSDPRRFYFVVGKGIPTHTAETQISLLYGKENSFADILNAFSLERVTKKFYEEVAAMFYRLVGGTTSLNGRQVNYRSGELRIPGNNHEDKKMFGIRLLDRLVFSWFLKKKVSRQGRPLIPNEVLSKTAVKNYKLFLKEAGFHLDNYYHDVLEPLFFEVMNKPQAQRIERVRKVAIFNEIPFLNGGLFEPRREDFYELDEKTGLSKNVNTISVPNKWFEELFEVFERYNFTVDENTPVDVELSIEPEMLGRIFENLLAELEEETRETARKATGSYYTPRPIVEFMVDESLKRYLKDKTGIPEEKLKNLSSYYAEVDLSDAEKKSVIGALNELKVIDPACGSGAFPIGLLQKALLILQKIDPDNKLWFQENLNRISDPALKEEFRRKLQDEDLNYIRKLSIIKNSIYGIDIQPMATEIAKLRTFLTLIVDASADSFKPNMGIEPLPNLEFKFVTANSLIDIEAVEGMLGKSGEGQSYIFGEQQFFSDFERLASEYFLESDPRKKQMLRSSIEKLIDNKVGEKIATIKDLGRSLDIRKAHLKEKENEKSIKDLSSKIDLWNSYKNIFTGDTVGFFTIKYFFPELKDGFDIVIANPPYVGEKGHKEIFREIAKGKLKHFYQRHMDIFYFFFHLSLNIGNENSNIAFITTNYYPTATSGKKLRQDFKNRAIIKNLINFNELKIFESAIGQHNMITILGKGQNENVIAHTCITHRQGIANPKVLQQIMNGDDTETDYYKVSQKDLYDGDEYYIRLTESSENLDNPIQIILDKINSQSVLLGIICNVNQGIVTGADKVSKKHIEKYKITARVGDGIFVLNKRELHSKNIKVKSTHIKPWFKNSDINKYSTSLNTNNFVLYFKDKKEKQYIEPSILKHFEVFKHLLIARLSVCKKNQFQWNIVSKWINRGEYYLLFYPRKQEIFESPKIVAPQRSLQNTFGYNEIPWYASADVYFITERDKSVSLKYILALLNSKLYYLWLYHRGKRKGEMLELYQKPLSEIPIKKVSPADQQPFISLVDKILSITKDDDYLENSTKQIKVKEYERQVDQMVYKLYGLTDDEIKIVEGEK